MSNCPHVFIGSTINSSDAGCILDAVYHPPIKRGDLSNVPHRSHVLIVDGEFGQTLPVSPKEILRFMEKGGVVYGAASMGALRAAELNVYGMIGIGWVFQSYVSKLITADDEVAVAMSPFTFDAITVPLVNVRWWLIQLVARSAISEREAQIAFQEARNIFFSDRTESLLFQKFRRYFGASRFASLISVDGNRIPDVKNNDAKEALKFLSGKIHETKKQNEKNKITYSKKEI